MAPKRTRATEPAATGTRTSTRNKATRVAQDDGSGEVEAAGKAAAKAHDETKQQEPQRNDDQGAKKPKKAAKQGPLSVGDQIALDLEVVRHDGTTVTLGALVEERPIVIFFYPRANTGGCTTQACGFRDSYSKFEAKGYGVYGLSADTPKAQTSWKEKHSFPYDLLSDRSGDRVVLKALGVNNGGSINRSHLVIAKAGKVEQVAYGVSPKQSFEQAVQFVEST